MSLGLQLYPKQCMALLFSRFHALSLLYEAGHDDAVHSRRSMNERFKYYEMLTVIMSGDVFVYDLHYVKDGTWDDGIKYVARTDVLGGTLYIPRYEPTELNDEDKSIQSPKLMRLTFPPLCIRDKITRTMRSVALVYYVALRDVYPFMLSQNSRDEMMRSITNVDVLVDNVEWQEGHTLLKNLVSVTRRTRSSPSDPVTMWRPTDKENNAGVDILLGIQRSLFVEVNRQLPIMHFPILDVWKLFTTSLSNMMPMILAYCMYDELDMLLKHVSRHIRGPDDKDNHKVNYLWFIVSEALSKKQQEGVEGYYRRSMGVEISTGK